MVEDTLALETNDQKIIEALIGKGKIKVWIPIMATNIYMVSSDGELNKVEAVRVRDL